MIVNYNPSNIFVHTRLVLRPHSEDFVCTSCNVHVYAGVIFESTMSNSGEGRVWVCSSLRGIFRPQPHNYYLVMLCKEFLPAWRHIVQLNTNSILQQAISEFPFQSESNCETILMKMTNLHENETECRTHFHMKGFVLRLVLKQRQENSEMAYYVGRH